jgi:hypothetical protein
MNHLLNDRESFHLFPIRKRKSGKLTSPAFQNNGKSSEKLEKLIIVPREVLFRAWEKLIPKVAFSHPQKQSTFSRIWEKLKWPKIPPRDIDFLPPSMLALSSITRWTLYPVPLSGKTPSKAAIFRLFFRLSPSNRHEQTPSKED